MVILKRRKVLNVKINFELKSIHLPANKNYVFTFQIHQYPIQHILLDSLNDTKSSWSTTR